MPPNVGVGSNAACWGVKVAGSPTPVVNFVHGLFNRTKQGKWGAAT
jgi:hypothetical protein